MSDDTDDPQNGTVDAAAPEVADLDVDVIDAEVVDADATATNPTRETTASSEDAAAGTLVDANADANADSDTGGADEIARERDEYLDALRQLQADFENFRKQTLRRQGDAIEHATGRLVEDLLTVLDACDAGVEHGDEGVVAIFATLLGVLEKAGLERLDPLGEPFDPNAHEAVLHEPDDEGGDGPTVAEVLRPGYRWKERTLRAAMVKVRG
ncbi:MAG TPA: nucleotide exchange factor GrpE [Acidimicrobiales bacterium]|nr:nucleotide exchange factor GrpE [Acidimicrobiales bacterium]